MIIPESWLPGIVISFTLSYGFFYRSFSIQFQFFGLSLPIIS